MQAVTMPFAPGLTLIDYGREAEQEIAALAAAIAAVPELAGHYPPRWLAIKLLEQDSDVMARVEADGTAVMAQAEAAMARLQQVYGDDVDTLIADRRYGFINGVVREAVGRPATQPLTLSDRIDRIVTNRWLGIPIFMLAMWFVFQMTANVSGYYMDWLDGVINGPIAHWIDALVVALGLGGTWVEALMLDGVVAGVGGVLVFVPLLLFLYFFLAILEDSGYMARAAFVMDRLMHALGLHGKSFLPMLVGFGCSVPGIYATRTLENEEDRRLTGLLVPMMSCGARLPVYAVFGAAFFPAHTGRFIFGLYLIGIVLAVVSGLVFKRLLFRNKPPAPFVMELPPYRVPSLRGVLTHMWERSASFVRRAGTIILGAAVVLWLLMNLPWGVESPRESVFGQVSNAISPIFAPAGFDRWEATGSLVTGLIAKEVVVGTMSQIYVGEDEAAVEEEATPTLGQELGGIVVGFGQATWDTAKATVSLIPGIDLMGGEEEEEDTALTQALQAAFTPLQALSFTLFVLLYIPCVAALGAMKQEFGTRWMLMSAGYLTLLGWVVSTVVYQGGRLLGLG
jgi:ferrous iron transport protein B